MPIPVAYRQAVLFTIVAVLFTATAAFNASTFEVGMAIYWWVLVAFFWWVAIKAKRKAERCAPR